MYNPAQQKGPAPSTARPGCASLQTPGWEGDPRGLAGTDDEAGFQARSPQDWGAQAPPRGRTWPLPLETPELGRGARRARRGSPINTKRGGCASPKDRICTGWHPRFPQETAAGSYKTFTASSPQRKKIRGWVRSDRGGTSCLKGLRLPCKAQGSPLHIQSWGHVGPLEPTKAGGLGAQGTKGNK
ncbi:hypothetical protein mRhiFer1_009636 [Rhinolophus ferrumequinum]|uniref:Uncharacterized protein n=1 Tax=Rhinolophus ferrumequinum TaxID=59479 RepID=A0A7J7R5T3_RHIFE|nr:hypothetical protein mRhiFer1_009636 [Rhinolophus ferrumequinum]